MLQTCRGLKHNLSKTLQCSSKNNTEIYCAGMLTANRTGHFLVLVTKQNFLTKKLHCLPEEFFVIVLNCWVWHSNFKWILQIFFFQLDINFRDLGWNVLPYPRLQQKEKKKNFPYIFLEGNFIFFLWKDHLFFSGNSHFCFRMGISREWLLILVLQ